MPARLIELDRQSDDVYEIGRVFLENGIGDLETRVVPYPLTFSRRGEPSFAYENETTLGKMEHRGMMSMYRLAMAGFDYVFWLSPPGGPANYPEGRLVVGKVVNIVDGVEFECRGVPILDDGNRLFDRAMDILKKGGVVLTEKLRGIEDLRENAIGINLGDEDLWGFCKEIFGMDEVWEVIERGEDVLRADMVIGEARQVLTSIRTKFGGRIDQSASLMAGILFEQMMASRGFAISGGNHGGTNSSLIVTNNTIFGTIFNSNEIKIDTNGEVKHKCKTCGHWYKGEKCPYCG